MRPLPLGLGRPRLDQVATALKVWTNPHCSRKAILEFQSEKLRRLIEHAYKNVSYYRRLFDEARIDPQEIRCAEDLERLPITSKLTMREHPLEDLMARGSNADELSKMRTSGSSGTRLTFWRDHFESHLLYLFRTRAFIQAGLRLGDRTAVVAADLPRSKVKKTPIAKLRDKAGILRMFRLTCRQSPESLVEELRRVNPDVILGYPGVMYHLAARHLAGKPLGISPRLIMCGGEPMIEPMRRTIEEAFGAKVVDVYSSLEVSLIAWQCPKTHLYHIADDSVIVEVLRDDKPVGEGERGQVVVTGLHSYVMPFIRYRLGDFVTKGPDRCECGQPFSTLEDIKGRVYEYYRLKDGRSIHHFEISEHLMDQAREWIARYQIIQEAPDKFRMRLVTSRPPAEEEVEGLKRAAAQKLGDDVEYRLVFESEIPSDPSGKYPRSINLVSSPYDGYEQSKM